MKKILFGLLGVLFSISANAACNLYTTTNSSAGYIDANGVVLDTAGYLATDYISITPSTEYTVYARMTGAISGHGIRIAFYDTNKQFIVPREGGEAGSSGQYIYNLTSPANAKYIRMSTSSSSSVVVDRTIVQGRYTVDTIPTNMSACANALPSGYTELEYIESTGTQYIDTGILNNSSIKMNFNVKPSSAVGSYFMGVDQGIIFGTNDGVHFRAVGKNSESSFNTNTFYNIEMYYSGGRRYCVIDGTETLDNGVPSLINAKINIFAAPNNSQIAYYLPWAIKDCKMWDNDTLVRNFIPAKRNSDNVIGMYDTVSGTFFTNAGTGEFIAGPDACNGTIVNYVSATGTGVQNGTPTPDNPIYPTFYTQGNMVLRKVGDYADTYDATTGKITRRVGVAVLDGTEDWSYIENNNNYGNYFYVPLASVSRSFSPLCNYFNGVNATYAYLSPNIPNKLWIEDGIRLKINAPDNITTVGQFKQWLAQQYANSTPVTIYYPLAEETTEDWPASYCETPIKIATTKYNESAFGPLNTALQNAISVVDSVVSNTITQAASIATLQAQKQTRPADDPTDANNAENCPAGKKCLLVEDASGTPHWYEIVEKYSRLPDGYTELEYIESTGTQYIDTGITNIVNAEFGIVAQQTELLSGFPTILGANDTTDKYKVIFGYGSSNSFYTQGGNGSGYIIAPSLHTDTNKHTFVVKNTASSQELTIDNQTVYGNYAITSSTTYPLYMFARSFNGGAASFTKQKVWSFYAKSNGSLTHNFIPAKNSSGVVGMYDTVSGRFFTNAGDGDFVAGPVSE